MEEEEATLRAVYRDFIDGLVATSSLVAQRQEPDALSSLPSEVQVMIDELRRRERIDAIHDVLAQLSWLIDVRDVTLVLDGSALPVDESGMGVHGDFIGRLDGWSWPTEE